MSLSYSARVASDPAFDRFDSGGTLAIASSVTSTQTSTTVTVQVAQPGARGSLLAGSVGSAVRIKNLRVDVSNAFSGQQIHATLITSGGGTPTVASVNVGAVFGTIDPTKTVLTAGLGMQNANGGLPANSFARFSFSEGFSNAFRIAAAPAVAGDIGTGPTRLVLDFGNSLPTGVTLTFPPQISATGLTLQLHSGGPCSGPATCVAIYDTIANASGNGT